LKLIGRRKSKPNEKSSLVSFGFGFGFRFCGGCVLEVDLNDEEKEERD